MTNLYPRCGAQLALTADEHEQLTALPQAALEVEEDVACELQECHRGPHVAIGQSCGREDANWWLRWAPGLRELKHLDDCDTKSTDDDELCDLPRGHPGEHGFSLEEAGGRAPSAWGRRQLAGALREELGAEQRGCLEELEALLTATDAPLAVLTAGEAIVAGLLLKMAGESDLLFEEMAEQLADRLEERLVEHLGEDTVSRLGQEAIERADGRAAAYG